MILIDAVYINQSGGKVLLEYFIKIIHEKDLIPNFVFLLDSRYLYYKTKLVLIMRSGKMFDQE